MEGGGGSGAGGGSTSGGRSLFSPKVSGPQCPPEYDRVVKDPPFNPHGQKVFTNGKNYITPDVDQHNGGVWKMFDQRGNRTGTYDADLNRIGK
jgi:Novel toxin 21